MSKAPPRKNDAVTLLDDEHIKVKKLFQEFDKLAENDGPADERKAIADQICMDLTIHMAIEEGIFYPALRAAGLEEDLMDEADVEHGGAKNLIAQIAGMDADASHYNAKVHVLGEMIDHHVGEERDEMFPKARSADVDLVALKDKLAERRAELEAEYSATA